jgi:hypothetical protein
LIADTVSSSRSSGSFDATSASTEQMIRGASD